MSWRIGDWQKYKEGDIHRVVKECVSLLQANAFEIEVCFDIEKKKIDAEQPEGGFLEALKEYEKDKGVGVLLEDLIRGMVTLRAVKEKDLQIHSQLLLRAPEDTQENRELFQGMITTWAKEDVLSFTERFFRLPKIYEDLADRYMDNPLEQVLRKTFGFHFEYKLIISSADDSSESQRLREALYQIVASS